MSAAISHTAVPWVRDSASGISCDVRAVSGRKVALCFGLSATTKMKPQGYARYRAECDANAHFIVKACNAHDDLVKALTELTACEDDTQANWENRINAAYDAARDLLAKVAGAES